jgi:sporulation protein YlmC with PRC-barrel domain
MGSSPDIDTALAWRGRTVYDQDGNKVGTLSQLYLDSETSRPAWAGVKRGLLRTTETIVPLGDAEEVGDELRLPYDSARIEEAPDVDPDVELTEEQERVLHEHYGRAWEPPADEGTEVAMTRSEEEVTVGKKAVKRAERVRLKKVLVEDEVTETVPVRREEIRLETEPPPEGRIESVEEIDEDQRP